MPRIARAVAVGLPHHVTQRGNYRQTVFQGDDDYLRYREWVTEYAGKYGLLIWAYCLMSNHVHFIAEMRGSSWKWNACFAEGKAPQKRITVAVPM